jgi:hypothetical protein
MTIMGAHVLTGDLYGSVAVPTLVIDGEASPPFMHAAARAVASAVPHAQYRTSTAQTRALVPEVLGPALNEFFGS